MLGGEFIRHDAQQAAQLIVTDSRFPGMTAIPPDYAPFEEWYSLKNFAPDLCVLLVQDTRKRVGPSWARPPYPLAWARRHGRRRVFDTSMGHREDVWASRVFQTMATDALSGRYVGSRRISHPISKRLRPRPASYRNTWSLRRRVEKNRGDRQQLKPAPESPGICLGRAGWSEKEERRAELTRVVLASEPLPIPPAASISSALRGRYGLGNCRPKRACRLPEFR